MRAARDGGPCGVCGIGICAQASASGHLPGASRACGRLEASSFGQFSSSSGCSDYWAQPTIAAGNADGSGDSGRGRADGEGSSKELRPPLEDQGQDPQLVWSHLCHPGAGAGRDLVCSDGSAAHRVQAYGMGSQPQVVRLDGQAMGTRRAASCLVVPSRGLAHPVVALRTFDPLSSLSPSRHPPSLSPSRQPPSRQPPSRQPPSRAVPAKHVPWRLLPLGGHRPRAPAQGGRGRRPLRQSRIVV